MDSIFIQPDPAVAYRVHEFGPIVLALAFVIAVGGVAAASIIMCGWRGTQNVALDWVSGKATFVCR